MHSRTAPSGSSPSGAAAAAAGGRAGGGGGGGRDVESAAGAEAERRYGRLYDEGINPFKEFKEQQKERQKSAMGLVDKVGVCVWGGE